MTLAEFIALTQAIQDDFTAVENTGRLAQMIDGFTELTANLETVTNEREELAGLNSRLTLANSELFRRVGSNANATTETTPTTEGDEDEGEKLISLDDLLDERGNL